MQCCEGEAMGDRRIDLGLLFNLRHFAISHVWEIVWGRPMSGGAGGSVLGI